MTDEKMLAQMKAFAKKSEKEMGAQLQRVQADLEFAGGAQFSEEDDAIRGKNRAKLKFNLVRNYANQIVAQYKAKPFGVQITGKNAQGAEKAKIAQALVRGIERQERAQKAYGLAIDRQVKGGRGYIVITTDYDSEEGWDQKIKIQGVAKPEMVLWDPDSKEVDGSDAQECAFVDYMPKRQAEELYGEEVVDGTAPTILASTRWAAKEDAVEVVKYFFLKKTRTTIYQDAEGNTLNQARKNSKMKSRQTTKTEVVCATIIGHQVISQTTLPLSRLPIVPVLGEMVDTESHGLDWVGITYFARDPQRLVNWSASLTAERISVAPKSTNFVDYKSIAPYKDIWQASNRINPPFLPYDSKDPQGNSYTPPTPRDVSVNISDVSQAQAQFQGLMSSIMGMNEAGGQMAGPDNETAASVLTKSRSSDLSSAGFLENAALSIQAVGRVMLELLPVVYDTTRLLPIENEESEVEMVEGSAVEWGIIPTELEVDVDAGPMAATQAKEDMSALLALGQLLGPEVALAFAPEIVRGSGHPDAEAIAEKLDVVAKTRLGLGDDDANAEPDPEALQALDAAQATVEELQANLQNAQAYIMQLQAQILADETSMQKDIAVEAMRSQNRLEVKAMEQETAITKTQMQILADADAAANEQQARFVEKMNEQPASNTSTNITIEAPNTPAVGGMRNNIF